MSVNYRILKWLGAGAAFAATVCAPGCSRLPWSSSSQQGLASLAETPPARPQLAPPAMPSIAPDRPAIARLEPGDTASPLVNIFGELDGIERQAPASASEFGLQQHTVCDEGYDADVATDPGGKWITFTSTRHSEQSDIYLQRVDGTSVIQLTTDPAADAQPAFSPDGKRIAFCSTRSGNWDIYVMDADGKNVEQVTDASTHEMHPSFSPDGSRLVYCALSPRTEQWELWIIDLASHSKKTIGQGLFPVWSPQKDVDRIAYQRARQRGSRWFSVWTLDLANDEPTRLTEVAVSSNAAVVSPAWSPDGQRLVFTTIPQPTHASGLPTHLPQDVWTVSVDGSNRQRLTHGDATNLSPIWGVDNRIYFISDRSGHENVWSVRVDASQTVTATASDPAHGASNGHAAKPSGDVGPGNALGVSPPTAVGTADSHEIGH